MIFFISVRLPSFVNEKYNSVQKLLFLQEIFSLVYITKKLKLNKLLLTCPIFLLAFRNKAHLIHSLFVKLLFATASDCKSTADQHTFTSVRAAEVEVLAIDSCLTTKLNS